MNLVKKLRTYPNTFRSRYADDCHAASLALEQAIVILRKVRDGARSESELDLARDCSNILIEANYWLNTWDTEEEE